MVVERFLRLSNRARNTPPSPIRRLAPLAQKAKSNGTKVYHLNIGQPDIETPQEFFEGVRNYSEKVLAYEQSGGNQHLRDVWCAAFNSELALSINVEDFLITTGASEGLIFLFMATCDPGDEIIVIDPTYANYKSFAAIAGVELISVQSSLEQGFSIPDSSLIEESISNRTRAILLCNPNNPTGTVYSKEELARLLEIANRHNLFFILDETYREFVYDGARPFSVFQLDSDNDRIVVVDSLSKRFSLCGARIGCLVTTNRKLSQAVLNIAQARLASPTIDQMAAAYMLERVDASYLQGVVSEYQLRRDTAITALSRITGAQVVNPQGAFYTLVRLPVKDSNDFARYLLEDFSCQAATTFVAPAEGFYMQSGFGRNEIRVAFVLEAEALKRSIEILGLGLEAYLTRNTSI
jgi:aspartate aminotransferase